MTRSLGANLNAHFQGEHLTVAYLWKVTRTDETVMGFTNHDQDIVYDTVTYKANTGMNPSEVAVKGDISVTNLDVQGFLDSSEITESDIHDGIYDYAEVEIMLINYENVGHGTLTLQRGTIGQINLVKGQFVAEIRGLTQRVQQNIGESYSPSCRAILGDTRCKLDLEAFTFSHTVTAVTSNQAFTAAGISQANYYFTGGEVVWTSGSNAGRRMEVKEHLTTSITLALPMPDTVQVGDGFDIIAGCDKIFSTCKDKFDNVVNFRGEPHVPGMDKIMETPGTAESFQE